VALEAIALVKGNAGTHEENGVPALIANLDDAAS
jgi:hypothetical protein